MTAFAFDTYLKALQQLHEAAGSPSSRNLASLSGGTLSHTTVNDLLKGRRIGAWRTTAPIVLTLAELTDDPEAVNRIHDLWSLVQREQQEQEKTPTAELLAQILQELQEQRAMLDDYFAKFDCPSCYNTCDRHSHMGYPYVWHEDHCPALNEVLHRFGEPSADHSPCEQPPNQL